MKICQSLFEYVGNLLFKSDTLEAGVWRIFWHDLPAVDFISGLTILSQYILQRPASRALSLFINHPQKTLYGGINNISQNVLFQPSS